MSRLQQHKKFSSLVLPRNKLNSQSQELIDSQPDLKDDSINQFYITSNYSNQRSKEKFHKMMDHLKNELTLKEKQLRVQQKLNEVQQIASQQKDMMLAEDRKELNKLKSLLSKKYLENHTTQAQINKKIIQKLPSNQHISTVIEKQNKNTESEEKQEKQEKNEREETEKQPNDATQISYLRRSKRRQNSVTAINFLQSEETFKVVELLSSELTREDALEMYQNDGSIAFVTQLIADEQRYFNIMANAGNYRLTLLLEKLRKVMADHKHLFNLVLRLKSVVNASIQLIQSHNLDEALQKIIFATSECLECDRATCFMVDQAKQELWSKVAQGVGKKIQFPMTQGIAGYAARHQSVVNIQDAYQDDRFNRHFDQLSNYRTKTILAMPILEKGNCLGVLQCINKFEGQQQKYYYKKKGLFTKEDELMLKMLGELANTVLKNVVKHKEQLQAQNKFRTALKASQLLVENCHDLPKLIQIGELWMRKLMNVDTVKISLKQNNSTIIQIEQNGTIVELPDNLGLVGMTLQSGEVYMTQSGYQDVNFHPKVDINTQLPILCYPIQKKIEEKKETIGNREKVQLININYIVSEFGQRLPPIDHEIAKKIIKLMSFTYNVWKQMHQRNN